MPHGLAQTGLALPSAVGCTVTVVTVVVMGVAVTAWIFFIGALPGRTSEWPSRLSRCAAASLSIEALLDWRVPESLGPGCTGLGATRLRRFSGEERGCLGAVWDNSFFLPRTTSLRRSCERIEAHVHSSNVIKVKTLNSCECVFIQNL